MNKPTILKIESAREMDGEVWEVGQRHKYDGGLISEIRDVSIVYINGKHVQYDIYVSGQLWKSLVNMHVKVEYGILI